MDKIKQFASFERVFLYGGLQDERGLPGMLIDIIIFGVLLALFTPLMPFQGVVLVLSILSMVWVKRCLRGRGKLFEMLPVSPGFAATAIWATPFLLFTVGYMVAYLVIAFVGYRNYHYIRAISYLFDPGYFSYSNSFALVIVCLVLLLFFAGSVSFQLRDKVSKVAFSLLVWLVYFLLASLNYGHLMYGDDSFAMKHISVVIIILLLLVLAELPLSVWLCLTLYKKRNSVSVTRSNRLTRFVSVLRVLLTSGLKEATGGVIGLLKLVLTGILFFAGVNLFYTNLSESWIFFIPVAAALYTLNLAVNGEKRLPGLLPVSKKTAFWSLFAFSAISCTAYYLIVINIINMAAFVTHSSASGMLLDIRVTGYSGGTWVTLMNLMSILILLSVGTAVLMARHWAIRIGGLALMTAAFYGFLSYYDIHLSMYDYAVTTDTHFFLFKIFHHLTIQNEILIYDAVAFAVFVPLSVFIGYKLYCGRFPKEIKA